MIKCAYDKAMIMNITTNNPFSIKGLITIPKSEKQDRKIDALTLEDQKLFINELNKNYDKYTDIFYILIYTGMRIGEVLALSNEDIDIDNKIIHIKKQLKKIKITNQ